MGKRKAIYQVYRHDDSEDENNEDLPQARVLNVRKNGRLIMESNRSPQKRGSIRRTVIPEDWEPSPYFDAGFEDSYNVGFDSTREGDDPEGFTVVAQAAARRYPTSVSRDLANGSLQVLISIFLGCAVT